MLGVSFDTVEENRTFAEAQCFPYPLLADPDRTLGESYGASKGSGGARRISYLIGPDQRIVKTYEAVKPAEHPDEVLRDLGA